jgi:Ca2+-dependent lipid-binding protein
MTEEDDFEQEIESKIKEMEDLKVRLAEKRKAKEMADAKIKDTAPVTPSLRKIRINTGRNPPQPRDPEQPAREIDPVDRYLNPDRKEEQLNEEQQEADAQFDEEEIRQVKKQDGEFIHKRIAAQEILRWLKISILLMTMNIIGFFVMYFLFTLWMVLIADIAMVAVIIFDGFYLMRMRKHQQYLINKYNIQRQPSMFSGMSKRAPQEYRQQQRPPRQQQRGKQPFYNDGRRMR